jgi:leader peptidase (prepilin peptidase) / N-methyltransferase
LAESIILGVLGLLLGRFLNLTIDRLPPAPATPAGSPAGGSSHRTTLLAALTPFIGYPFPTVDAAQPSRRNRGWRLRYPAVVLITAALGAFVGHQHGLTPAAAVLLLYCALLIHLAFVDLEHSLVLNKVVLPALPLAVALFPFSPLGQTWDLGEAYLRSLQGAGLGFGVMLLIYLASRGGMGAGDVKLAAVLGAALGFPQIVAGLPIGFVIGGLAGMAVLALRVKGRKDTIPFGPSLIIGAALVLLGGSGVYGWYLDLFR